jgi:hypothetical protein
LFALFVAIGATGRRRLLLPVVWFSIGHIGRKMRRAVRWWHTLWWSVAVATWPSWATSCSSPARTGFLTRDLAIVVAVKSFQHRRSIFEFVARDDAILIGVEYFKKRIGRRKEFAGTLASRVMGVGIHRSIGRAKSIKLLASVAWRIGAVLRAGVGH